MNIQPNKLESCILVSYPMSALTTSPDTPRPSTMVNNMLIPYVSLISLLYAKASYDGELTLDFVWCFNEPMPMVREDVGRVFALSSRTLCLKRDYLAPYSKEGQQINARHILSSSQVASRLPDWQQSTIIQHSTFNTDATRIELW
jgi:hypothetical protein